MGGRPEGFSKASEKGDIHETMTDDPTGCACSHTLDRAHRSAVAPAPAPAAPSPLGLEFEPPEFGLLPAPGEVSVVAASCVMTKSVIRRAKLPVPCLVSPDL